MEKKQFEEIIKKEGDFEKGTMLGLPFIIWRHPETKHWCGYVGVPKDSRLHGKEYYISTESENGLSKLEEAINNISVHGGLTAAGELGDRSGDDVWYFGFDCAHGGDLVSYMFDYPQFGDESTYKDKNFIMTEVENLARQLKEIIDLKL